MRAPAPILLLCLAALACSGAAPTDDELIQQLESPRWQIRSSAAAELGRRHVDRAVPRLAPLLEDPRSEARGAAVMAFGRIGARSEIDAVRRVIDRDESPQVRVLAIYALADLTDPAQPPSLEDENRLVDLMYNESRRVKRAARRVLPKVIGEERARPHLEAYRNRDDNSDEASAPTSWRYDRIEDRVEMERDGECTLTRTFTVRSDGTYILRRIVAPLPEEFAEVEEVRDAEGNDLDFGLRWDGQAHLLSLNFPGISTDETVSFTFTARSRRPVFGAGGGEVYLVYSPVPVGPRAAHLRVELSLPVRGVRPLEPEDLRLRPQDGGEGAVLERSNLASGEADEPVVRVAVPAASLQLPRPPPRFHTRAGDLALAGAILAVTAALLAVALFRLRRRVGEWSHRAILVTVLTAGAFLFLSPILLEDNLAYYAGGRSAVLDGDLDRANEFTELNQTVAYAPVHRGPLDPYFPSLFATPFVVAAGWITALLDLLGAGYAPTGFSFPYLFVMAIGDFLAVLIGCLACFSLIERRIGRPYALFGVLSVVAGTNLLLFTYGWIGGSFQPSFLLFSLFLNHWDRSRDRRGTADWLIAGVLLGLLGMTRTLNLGFVVIPFLDWLHAARLRAAAAGVRGLARHAADGAVFTAGMVLGFGPQLVLHRLVDDSWVVDSYGVGSGRLSGISEHWKGLLLGQAADRFDGLLLTMPLICLAVLGLVALIRYDRRLGTLAAVALAVQLLGVASYEVFWGYFEYGTPYFVPSSPIFCLGMGALMRAVHARWRTAGAALLCALAVPLVVRNGWCVMQQLGSDIVTSWSPDLGAARILHSLLIPDRKLDGDLLRCSTEFACLPREILGALQGGSIGQLLAALGWAALLFGCVFLAYRIWNRIERRDRAEVPPARRRVVLLGSAVAWLVILGWLVRLGYRTDVDYRFVSERQTGTKQELTIELVDPEGSFDARLSVGGPIASVDLVTFLDDAEDIPQGTPVASVTVKAAGGEAQFDLLAGIDTADFRIERAESRAERAHSVPLDRACFAWRVRDDSSRFYTARAYLRRFAVPFQTDDAEIEIRSKVEHGTLAVLMVNAIESKLPRDRSRRRWLAEQW